MKFTRNDVTNQRIERITREHVVVGIDIAKDVHAVQAIDYRGRVLTKHHLSFANSEEGFTRLQGWIQDVLAKHGKSRVLAGMEPTGHYWHNLANWLLARGIEVALVNPVTTHRNKENRDNSPSKNDPKDALTIADAVSRGFYTEFAPQATNFERMKTLVSTREYWSKQSVSTGNRIVRWIDLYFPEFRQVFPEWETARSLATLRAFALPADLNDLGVDEVLAGWRSQGMQRAGGVSGKAKAAELLRYAARSIGKADVPAEARQEIRQLLAVYAQLQTTLDDVGQQMTALLDDMPLAKQLRSIPGLGPITLAVVLGCAGDLRLYGHGRQLLRRAGLNLAERTSGKFKGQIKLSKRGDSVLRKHLYWGMLSLVRDNPDFKHGHAQNQRRGMSKMASLFKLIGKLARILIGMVQRGETYRSRMVETMAV